jgi:hypothetical protein
MRQDHYSHSSLVRHGLNGVKQTANAFALGWKESDTYHALRSPFEGYAVRVSFSTFDDQPDHIRIRSTNWRCEHEPNGVYSKEDARKFYRKLLDAGFVKE